MKKESKQGGFIELIIVIIVLLLLMKYFNLTVSGLLNMLVDAFNWAISYFKEVLR